MVFPQFQELSDFSQGETQALHLPDKVQPSHVIIGIEPEPTCCARSLGKQGAALIKANGIHGECRQLCNFSDLHGACGAIRNLGHIERIHSGVQSRVKGLSVTGAQLLAVRCAHESVVDCAYGQQ